VAVCSGMGWKAGRQVYGQEALDATQPSWQRMCPRSSTNADPPGPPGSKKRCRQLYKAVLSRGLPGACRSGREAEHHQASKERAAHAHAVSLPAPPACTASACTA
jgi:hypothetical protein